ncbi:MAG: hypothetical protein RLZZ08_1199 [Pseudomonadota bacterium]|jgi:lysozyme
MGRKQAFSWRRRIAAFALLLVLVGGAAAWWQGQHWAPAIKAYPSQGALIGAADDGVDFKALKAIGARFVYLEASAGAVGRDPAFAHNLEAVQGSGLRYGAVHEYDPCIPAEKQAANFVTIVPRDAALLPPAIALDKLAVDCADAVSEEAVESELTTFLNQVESHVGQSAVLKISPAFEEHYRISRRMERNLWLERNWMEPEYAGRPWTLWTANSALRTEAAPLPLRWVVLQQ